MSILIKNMEMPKCCRDCRFCAGLADTEWGTCAGCLIDDECREASSKSGCPVVEIPTPHGRLIDADELIDGCEKLMRMLDPTEGKDYLRVFAIKSYLMWAAEYAVIKAERSAYEQD